MICICPVCAGKTVLPSNFYPDIPQNTGTPLYVACRSCGGTGVFNDTVNIKVPDTDVHGLSGGGCVIKDSDAVCTCPPTIASGELYIGDIVCPLHGVSVNC